ncbi:MAG: hypothetical protein DRI22_01760, partial [Caldiserica bacterium]
FGRFLYKIFLLTSLVTSLVTNIFSGVDAKLDIKDGKARFLHSPCKKKICEKRGWISKEGEYAICIPNGVFIWIGGDDLDAVSE